MCLWRYLLMDYDFFLGFLLVFGFDIIENVFMNCFFIFKF